MFTFRAMAVVSIRYFRKSRNGFALIILFGIVCIASSTTGDGFSEPYFAEPIPNITVSAGRDVSLPCIVENLGSYRVAWIHTDRYTLLTLQNRVITRNSRYKVTHNSHRTWWLHIYDVMERDKGEYMCQINTSPMKSQAGYVTVVVPPTIDEEKTSSDTEVREGNDVHLVCDARGAPEPEVKWRREDGFDIPFGKEKVNVVHGMYLNIKKVSRLHMGAYLCIASNGVQPSISKRVVLNVNFPPMVWIPNQLVGAPVGSDVILDCNLESHPRSVTFWTREGGIMILSNDKYDSIITSSARYKVQMSLRIRKLKHEDFGSYTCVAKNSLGETEGTIRLYEISPPSSQPTTEGSEPFHARSEKLQNGNTMSIPESESEGSPSHPSVNLITFDSENDFQDLQKGSMETGHNRSESQRPKSALLSSAIFAYLFFFFRLQNPPT